MAIQVARIGWSGTADFICTPGSDNASAWVVEAEADILSEPYLGLSASADLLMETDGAGSAPYAGYLAWIYDTSTVSVQLDFELQGAVNDSFIFILDRPDVQDARILQQSIVGLPEAGETFFWFLADQDYEISDRSTGWAENMATADAVFYLKNEGVTVATVTFESGEITPILSISNSTVSVGDRLSFHAPVSQDATLSDLLVVFFLIFARP